MQLTSISLALTRLYGGNNDVSNMLAVLSQFGADAHLYLPGPGVQVAGPNLALASNFVVGVGGYNNTLANVTDSGATAIPGTTASRVALDFATVVGRIYTVTMKCTESPASGTLQCFIRDQYNGGGSSIANTPVMSLNTPYSLQFIATSTASSALWVTSQVAQGFTIAEVAVHDQTTQSIVISGITAGNYLDSSGTTLASVDGLVGLVKGSAGGIHASQAADANKPTLRRGAVNRIAYGADFTQANWGKVNLTVAGELISRTTTGSPAYTIQGLPGGTALVGATYTVAAKVKVGTQDNFVGIRAQGSYPARADVKVNLLDGSFTQGNNTYPAANISVAGPDSQGYYLVAMSGVTAGTELQAMVVGPTTAATTVSSWESASATPCDCNIQSTGVFAGAYTADQILALGGIPVTGATAASGSAGTYGWEFDGGNDYLSLSSVPFQATDDFVILSICNSRDLAQGGKIVSLQDTATQIGLIEFAYSIGKLTAQIRDDSSAIVSRSAPTANTDRNVGSFRKIGTSAILKVNGSQVGTSIATAGLGMVTLTGAAIGATPTGANLTRGTISSVCLIKGTVSDTQLLTIERGLNALSGYAAGNF